MEISPFAENDLTYVEGWVVQKKLKHSEIHNIKMDVNNVDLQIHFKIQ